MIVATTTATIVRPVGTGDPYEAATTTTVASGLRAHFSAPSGEDRAVGGDKELISATAYLPAGVAVQRLDRITDDNEGSTYAVVWSRARQGLGLDHVVVGLRAVNGGAA